MWRIRPPERSHISSDKRHRDSGADTTVAGLPPTVPEPAPPSAEVAALLGRWTLQQVRPLQSGAPVPPAVGYIEIDYGPGGPVLTLESELQSCSEFASFFEPADGALQLHPGVTIAAVGCRTNFHSEAIAELAKAGGRWRYQLDGDRLTLTTADSDFMFERTPR